MALVMQWGKAWRVNIFAKERAALNARIAVDYRRSRLFGRPARMRREHRADRRESRERASLSAPSLKPFLFFGKAGPRLRFREQEAFQLGRRRFLGKLHTPCGLLVGFLGAHARSPRPPLPSCSCPGATASRQVCSRFGGGASSCRRLAHAIHTCGRYGGVVAGSIFLVFGKAGVTSHLAVVSRPSAAAT
jgi:hypothetical protein